MMFQVPGNKAWATTEVVQVVGTVLEGAKTRSENKDLGKNSKIYFNEEPQRYGGKLNHPVLYE